MALNTLKCNHLTPLGLKGLMQTVLLTALVLRPFLRRHCDVVYSFCLSFDMRRAAEQLDELDYEGSSLKVSYTIDHRFLAGGIFPRGNFGISGRKIILVRNSNQKIKFIRHKN